MEWLCDINLFLKQSSLDLLDGNSSREGDDLKIVALKKDVACVTTGNRKKAVEDILWYFCIGVFRDPFTLLNWAFCPFFLWSLILSIYFYELSCFWYSENFLCRRRAKIDYIDPSRCTVGAEVTWICPAWQFLQKDYKHGCYISLPTSLTYLSGLAAHSSYSLHTFLYLPLFHFILLSKRVFQSVLSCRISSFIRERLCSVPVFIFRWRQYRYSFLIISLSPKFHAYIPVKWTKISKIMPIEETVRRIFRSWTSASISSALKSGCTVSARIY